MATFELQNKTALTTPASLDLIPIHDESAGSYTMKKITVGNLFASPLPIGSTAANTGAFTTLSASGLITASSGISFGGSTLSSYAVGSWTPSDQSGAGLSFTITGTPSYIRKGNSVFAFGTITFPATASSANISIGGLPFTSKSNGGGGEVGTVQVGYNNISASTISGLVNQNATTFKLFSGGSSIITNATASGKVLVFTIDYYAA